MCLLCLKHSCRDWGLPTSVLSFISPSLIQLQKPTIWKLPFWMVLPSPQLQESKPGNSIGLKVSKVLFCFVYKMLFTMCLAVSLWGGSNRENILCVKCTYLQPICWSSHVTGLRGSDKSCGWSAIKEASQAEKLVFMTEATAWQTRRWNSLLYETLDINSILNSLEVVWTWKEIFWFIVGRF